MTEVLDPELFKRVEVGHLLYYLAADVGDYEITIEPHLSAGYSVGIYAKSDPLLSIKKRSVWKFNHPTNRGSRKVEAELMKKALEIAQYYYEFYQLKNKEAVPPLIGKKYEL